MMRRHSTSPHNARRFGSFVDRSYENRVSNLETRRIGEGGIRTPGTFRYSGFQDRRLQPLGHLSLVPLGNIAPGTQPRLDHPFTPSPSPHYSHVAGPDKPGTGKVWGGTAASAVGSWIKAYHYHKPWGARMPMIETQSVREPSTGRLACWEMAL